MSLASNWQDVTLIAFDLETSGKYPLEAEICEMAAVKWRGGEIVDRFQSLIQTTRPMGEEVIKIHNITNEMLVGAPTLKDKIHEFAEFLSDGYPVAHHAPFDLGFLAAAFEDHSIPLLKTPVFCSSLMSRKKIIESPNHRLQTLVKILNIDSGQAHRALDDARVCLEVIIECFKRVGESANIDFLFGVQGGPLEWKRFSIMELYSKPELRVLIQALRDRSKVQLTYRGGSRPGQARTVMPMGLVRSPNGDFLVAQDEGSTAEHPKRYFVDKITGAAF